MKVTSTKLLKPQNHGTSDPSSSVSHFYNPETPIISERYYHVPEIDGLSTEETQVLIALSRHPFGLISLEECAKAARVSPFSAQHAVAKLILIKLVEYKKVRLFDGSVQYRDVISVIWHSPAWQEIRSHLATAVLPPPGQPPQIPEKIPPRLGTTFWSGDWRNLDIQAHPTFVAYRILTDGINDPEALAFLGLLPPSAVEEALDSLERFREEFGDDDS